MTDGDKYISEEAMYQDFVVALGLSREGRGLKQLNRKDKDEYHMLMGLASEVGELVGAYKKSFAYGQHLDRFNVVEELGDILFYLTGLAVLQGCTITDLREGNSIKLFKRYPNGYSHTDAKERKDKK